MRALWALGIILIAFAPAAAGDSLTEQPLKYDRQGGSAVWTGEHLFILGGGSRDIVRWDPDTNTSVTMGARLPFEVKAAGVAYVGGKIYVFGGDETHYGRSVSLDTIYRYDVSADAVATLETRLLVPSSGLTAVTDGTVVYLIGGANLAGNPPRAISVFDPRDLSIHNTTATVAVERASGVWTGDSVLIFGGNNRGISEFFPSNETVRRSVATLPEGMNYWTASAWDGEHAFVFGGSSGTPIAAAIVKYNRSSDKIVEMRTKLPIALDQASAVWTGDEVLVIGGHLRPSGHLSFRYSLRPGPVENVDTFAGPAANAITVRWDPPAENSMSSTTGYVVMRSSTPDGEAVEVARLPLAESTFSERDVPSLATYRYDIYADSHHGLGEAARVLAAPFRPPEPPVAFQASVDVVNGTVELSWKTPDSEMPLQRYVLTMEGAATQRWTLESETSLEIASLTPGAYAFSLAAESPAGQSRAATLNVTLNAKSATAEGDSQSRTVYSAESPALVNASRFALYPGDLGVGWRLVSDSNITDDSSGFRGGHRTTVRLQNAQATATTETDAYLFTSPSEARAFYDARAAEIQRLHGTEERRLGHGAIYWKESQFFGGVREGLLMLSQDLVWQVEFTRPIDLEGKEVKVGTDLDDIARALLAKVESGDPGAKTPGFTSAAALAAVGVAVIVGRRLKG